MSFLDDLANGLVGIVGEALGATVSPVAVAAIDLRDARGVLADELELAEPFDGAEGVARLTLRNGAEGLNGSVPAGVRLTIAGDRFEVGADAQAENDVLAVALTPLGEALEAPYGAGVDVAMDWTVEFALPASVEHGVSTFGVAPELVERAACRLLVPKAGAPALFRPRVGMVVQGSSRGTLSLLAEPDSNAGSWTFVLGRAA